MTGAGLDASIHVERGSGFVLDIVLEVPAGATAALLGPNGAGKSTTASVLAGLIPLTSGHVRLGGRTLDDPAGGVFVPPEDRGVGMVFQDSLLFPHMTVRQNVAFGLESRGMPSRQAAARAGEWLRRLGLEELAGRRPARLSGGQAQQVALARALVTEPELVLLDEPLSALDVTTRARFRRSLADHLGSCPCPRLLITHDPAEAFLLADVVHVIEDGRLTQVGTPDEIRRSPRTAYAADLAGINLFPGSASGGVVRLESGHELRVADSGASGLVLVTVHPRSVSLHPRRPEGSPRNVWPSEVVSLERLGDRVRVQLGEPLPLTAEITPSSADSLGLAPGVACWVAIKATEVEVRSEA